MPKIIHIGKDAPAVQTETTAGDYEIRLAADTTGKVVSFAGPAEFNLNIIASVDASYTLEATGGAALTVTSQSETLSTTNLVINGNSSITFTDEYGNQSAVTASFTGGGGGTLGLPPGQTDNLDTLPVVSGFGPGDDINFGTGAAADTVVYTPTGSGSGKLTLKGPHGHALGSVTLLGDYTQSDFVVVKGSNGIEEIEFACFLAGTMVLTLDGEVAVERLQAGDEVMTAANGPATVKAVRLRSFAAGVTSAKLLPVCITAGALAENVPHRDLWVSPDHSMYLHEVLVPAQLLVNGETIIQPARSSAISYFHVEIEPHDIIIAEGAATESYLDIGSRGHFAEAGGVSLLPVVDPKTWEDACAPLVLTGPQLAAVKAELAQRTRMLVDGRGDMATAA